MCGDGCCSKGGWCKPRSSARAGGLAGGGRREEGAMEQLKTFVGRELAMAGQGSWGSSKEFLDLVKAIGEAKSKAEEDRIVTSEIETLKKKIAEPDVPKRKMKEYIIRLVYVEMLGHDASFGYIHAVKMTHDDNLLLKKTGYLAVTLFLDENHDLIILIVNTIQKDLKSDNHLVVCAALGAVCKLINEETIPAVLPQVVELLNHPKEVVRKKSVMALHHFYQKSPSSVSHVVPKFRQVLCDKDPSVMSAALCALYDLVSADVASYKNLVASFVSILKQVAESRLPNAYNYHKTSAPFVQIKLLKILALLGANDKGASEHMYAVLTDVLKRSDSSINIGNAILYECCCTITSIFPSTKLLVTCADITSRFLKSDSHNLKYMGIDALGRVVKINSEFANEHQLAVIDCLEDPDDTLKRKTLDLLYKMTSAVNVEVIVERMIQYMGTVQDAHGKLEIASRIIELAERYAPTNQWFIQTMNSVFELAGDLVRPKAAHDLMRLIAEGSGEDDDDADTLLRSSAVESYLKLLEEPKLPSILLQVICWVLGEYGTADGTHSTEDIISRLCDVAESHSTDDVVLGYAISAITKIIAFEIGAGRRPRLFPEVRSLIDDLSASHSTDLQQRAYELQSLMGLTPETVASVLPRDASCEDIEVDKSLSFLDNFVREALEKGAKPYLPESERNGNASSMVTANADSHEHPAERSLRFEAYEKPTIPVRASTPPLALPSSSSSGSLVEQDRNLPRRSSHGDLVPYKGEKAALPEVDLSKPESARLRLDGVQKKWGRPTYTPAASAASSSERNPHSNGAAPADSGSFSREPSGGAAYEPPPRYGDRRKKPEVSEEKQKLAASLFGGVRAGEGGGVGRAAGSKAGKPSAAKSEQARPGSGGGESKHAAPAPPKEAPPPPPDLLNFGDDEPAPPQQPSVDPFKQLEGLLSVDISPALTSGNGTSAHGAVGELNLLSLSDGGPLPGLASGPAAGLVKKGPSSEAALQKDAVARQAGVITSGTNPVLFKDIFS